MSSVMSRIIDREKFLDNCIHTFLSVHSDIQQPYTCTIYTRVLVYRYRFEHALLLRTRAQASRCCGLHRCPSSCLSLHTSSSSGGGSSRWGLRWHTRTPYIGLRGALRQQAGISDAHGGVGGGETDRAADGATTQHRHVC